MVFDTKIPLKRDWLTEALEIANGKSDKNPKKEHIKALAEAYAKAYTDMDQMRDLLKKALEAAKRKRAAAGLPIMSERPSARKAHDG